MDRPAVLPHGAYVRADREFAGSRSAWCRPKRNAAIVLHATILRSSGFSQPGGIHNDTQPIMTKLLCLKGLPKAFKRIPLVVRRAPRAFKRVSKVFKRVPRVFKRILMVVIRVPRVSNARQRFSNVFQGFSNGFQGLLFENDWVPRACKQKPLESV